MIRSFSLASAALIAALAIAPRAEAVVYFEIERLSDTEAKVTGSGVFDIETPGSYLSLAGATSVGDGGTDPLSDSTMTAGPLDLGGVFTAAGTTNYFMRFGEFLSDAVIPEDSVLAGMFSTILDSETWGAVGTSGNVLASTTGALLGSYSIVATSAVPLPAGGVLLLTGLMGLAAARRKRQV